MKLSVIKLYWVTLRDTAMWNQKVSVVTYHDKRILWQGTVGEFVENPVHSCPINNDSWTVVFFGHPAITEADEAIPVYNRPIEIQVI